jgi:hypothetical protein
VAARDSLNFIEDLLRRRTDTFGQYHSPFLQGDERPFEMDAEQVSPAEVPANGLGGDCEVLIAPARLEYGRRKKAGGSEARTGLGYGLKGFGRAVEHVGAAGPLNVDVDETRGDYLALRIEHVVAAGLAVSSADLGDDAIFDKNGSRLFVILGIEQPTVLYDTAFWHIALTS